MPGHAFPPIPFCLSLGAVAALADARAIAGGVRPGPWGHRSRLTMEFRLRFALAETAWLRLAMPEILARRLIRQPKYL